MQKSIQCIFLIVCTTLTACNSTESENVKSTGIRAEIEVTSKGQNSAHVKTRLVVGSGGVGGTELELSPSDTLIAYVNGTQHTLFRSSSILSTYYETNFSFGVEPINIEFRIEFDRTQDVSAPNSVVMLPEPFSIMNFSNVQYDRNADITISWDSTSTGKNIILHFFGNCRPSNGDTFTRIFSRSSPDNGRYTINASELLSTASSGRDDSGGCDFNVHLKRKIAGNLDPNYGEGGFIYGIQERVLSLSIAAAQ